MSTVLSLYPEVVVIHEREGAFYKEEFLKSGSSTERGG